MEKSFVTSEPGLCKKENESVDRIKKIDKSVSET